MVSGKESVVFSIDCYEEFYQESGEVVEEDNIFFSRSWRWSFEWWRHCGWLRMVQVEWCAMGHSGWEALIVLWVRSRWFFLCILFALRNLGGQRGS